MHKQVWTSQVCQWMVYPHSWQFPSQTRSSWCGGATCRYFKAFVRNDAARINQKKHNGWLDVIYPQLRQLVQRQIAATIVNNSLPGVGALYCILLHTTGTKWTCDILLLVAEPHKQPAGWFHLCSSFAGVTLRTSWKCHFVVRIMCFQTQWNWKQGPLHQKQQRILSWFKAAVMVHLNLVTSPSHGEIPPF